MPDSPDALPAEAPPNSALPDTPIALSVTEIAASTDGPVLLIACHEQQAYRLDAALRFFSAGQIPVIHLPSAETLPYDPFSPHQELLSDRMAALNRLPALRKGIVLVTVAELLVRLPPRSFLDARSLQISLGEQIEIESFRERLIAAGYAAVGEVQTQGEFALRGAIIDLFPMGSDDAFRIDLFDDEIESIRTFDPETQRSIDKVERVDLLPAREFPTDKEAIERFRRQYREYFPGDPARSRIYAEVSRRFMPAGIEAWLPLFFETTDHLSDYLPASTKVIRAGDTDDALDADWHQIADRFERLCGDIERPLMSPADLFCAPEQVSADLEKFDDQTDRLESATSRTTLIAATPNGEAVRQFLKSAEVRTLFVAESPGRRQALQDWLKAEGIKVREQSDWAAFVADKKRFGITLGAVQESLHLPEQNLALISEAQIFTARAPVESRKRAARVRDPETILRDLSTLDIGSPVVHVQHGVGRYRGLTRMEAGGEVSEFLLLEYKDGDKLYVPVGSLQLIHRFTGSEDESAPLHSLGSERWKKAQAKARDKAADVAAELLQIQARRAAKEGLNLEVDDADFRQFCEGFPFDTTVDQQSAIDAVLGDLSSNKSMDRVVCGDVGFGKTEVALRACFAVARAGRQVCVLAPTTLLVQQHEKNFQDRMADWPLRIAALSRLRSSKEQNVILKEVAEGKIDVVIGTHRLLQPDIKFKNLGLVVVDEEHRFGVRHKERLKNLRAEVDLLTLTATPIPRTLNMSLAGLRDMSIIATPPASRIAIKTFVADWDRQLVIEACQRELRRGGQVYILHNEVADIEKFSRDVQEMVPEGRVRFAHGQMRERELEQVMLDFYHQRFDVLVCTTIIESGIDVPTANTMLIDRADKLGLAQLHQLRGRVGRSHHRAYAYFLVPSKRNLSADAQKRLDAIESLGDLGSGFALATHDLEIRGAGELLGEDQSGQIEEIGFTMYAELLARAVKAIKSGKLADAPFGAFECEVDLGVSALIPDDYVPDVHVRLVLYKRLAEAGSVEEIDELKVEMIDRFGLLPSPLERLVEASLIRIRGKKLGLSKVRASKRGLSLDFGPSPRIEPQTMIRLIQAQPKVYKLEGDKRLLVNAPLDAPSTDEASRQIAKLVAKRPKSRDVGRGRYDPGELTPRETAPETAAPPEAEIDYAARAERVVHILDTLARPPDLQAPKDQPAGNRRKGKNRP